MVLNKSTKEFLLVVLIIIAVSTSVISTSGYGYKISNTVKVDSMPLTEKETTEIELIADALQLFIQQYKHDPQLKELSLNEQSITGRRIKERSDLRFLGDWVIQGEGSNFQAIWSIEVGPEENTNVIVDLAWKKNKYIINNWTVEDTF